MSLKEQNKPETVNENTKHIIAAAELHSCYAENFDTKENAYLDGVKYGAHVALTYASENMYSREDCEKMLEALKQSILDLEVLREVNTCRIESIDVHQFIPPLTKQ